MKDDDGAGHLSARVVYGCGGVFNGGLVSVTADQNTIAAQTDGLVLQDRQCEGIQSRFAAVSVDDSQHLLQWPAAGFLPVPAGHAFSNPGEVGAAARARRAAYG